MVNCLNVISITWFARLLEDTDPDVQLKALDCLLNWRDEFLIPYSQHLKTLIASKSLREELTTWTLSKDSNQIQEEHRGYLVPVVIRLLMPKVIKLKTLASRKVRTKLYLYLANLSQHVFIKEILSIQALLD